MIAVKLLIGLSLLNPFGHHPREQRATTQAQASDIKTQERYEQMQEAAEDFEGQVLKSLPDARIKYPTVPDEYFTAIEKDIYKLSQENVTDPEFRGDWDELGDDLESMQWAIDKSAWPRV